MTDEALPKIDFSTFVISMSQSALIQLGELPHPENDAIDADLPLARQTIDLLGVIEEKTKGNLSGDEERLLTHVLFDLRMRFIEKEKKKNG